MYGSLRDSLDWIVDYLTSSVATGARSPALVLCLLRRYVASGRPELRAAIETGLTAGLDAIAAEPDPRRRCQWLGVFAEATVISDDERLARCVQSHLAPTIDGLERLVRSNYEPGEGLVGANLDEHLRSAVAFLTAFELTGRLPYPMLAEELLQAARRRWWDGNRFGDAFGANATAAQVLCRLAALHRDPDYAASAVVAPHADYSQEAAQILATLEPIARANLDDAADYGLALVDWFALQELPN